MVVVVIQALQLVDGLVVVGDPDDSTIVDVDEVVEYADAAQLLKTLRDSGTTDDSRRVPAGALRRVLREYADRFSRENGRVVATWRVLRVEALRI